MDQQQDAVWDFHDTFGLPIPEEPTFDEITPVRFELIREEVEELKAAEARKDIIGVIDALVDIQYVVNGYAVALGVDLEPFFDAVHQNNMTKVCQDCGAPHYREDGKVIKPDSYVPVDLKSLFQEIYPNYNLEG